MPTAAKLVSALLFGVIGYLAARAVIPAMPEGHSVGRLVPLSAGLGVVTGWLVMGGLVGRGLVAAAGQGLRTSVTLLFWVLVATAIVEMLRRALRKTYDDPMEAVVSVLELMLGNLLLAATPAVLGTLVLGGCVAGVLAELAHRRWK